MSTETAVARKTETLVDVLRGDAMKSRFAEVMPKICDPGRFVRIALMAVNKNPDLMKCTRDSVLSCLMDLAQFGVEPDGRLAHLIPYKDKCTLILDYKALIALAKRNGDVKSWRAQEVCENDVFEWENGRVRHVINWKADRGEIVAYYSHVVMNDGVEDCEVMKPEECEAIRKRSKAGHMGPWITDRNEMCKKTCIRRHSKRMTLSPLFGDALERDGDQLADPPAPVVAKPKPLFQAPQIAEQGPSILAESVEVPAETEVVDPPPSAEPPAEAKDKNPNRGPSINATQEKVLMETARKNGKSFEALRDHIRNEYGLDAVRDLPKSEFDAVLKWAGEEQLPFEK